MTYYDLIQKLKDVDLPNVQTISTDIKDLDSEILYSAIIINPVRSRFLQHQWEVEIQISYCDLIDDSRSNLDYIWSNGLLVIQKMINELNKLDLDFKVVDGTPFESKYHDIIAGWYSRVIVTIDNEMNCNTSI